MNTAKWNFMFNTIDTLKYRYTDRRNIVEESKASRDKLANSVSILFVGGGS